MRVLSALLATFAFALPVVAAEEKAEPSAGLSGFEAFGYKIDKKISDKSCGVTATLTQSKMLENFELLQKLGIFNSDMEKSTVREKPNTISMAFMIQIMPLVTKDIYDGMPTIDRCMFSQKMSVVDDYGNDHVFTAFEYRFDRALYKKINWDNFQPIKAIKVFPNFRQSPEMSGKMAEEMR